MRPSFGNISMVFALLLTPAIAYADPSMLPRTMWSAFECHQYANTAENGEESERLFSLGYRSGQEVFEIINAEGAASKVFDGDVPFGLSFVWAGPTEEFVLGRAYQFISDSASEKISEATAEPKYDEELRKLAALQLFQRSNCSLLRGARH